MRTAVFTALALCACSAATTPPRGMSSSEGSTFLGPYIAELRSALTADQIAQIRAMRETDLIALHLSLGKWIRNKWLWGDRDPKLVQFFRDKGISDPEAMSMHLIDVFWRQLNKEATPEEKSAIAEKRRVAAEKRASYDRIMRECADHLARHLPEFEACYAKFGLPSRNPKNRDPFSALILSESGNVSDIEFFTGAGDDVKDCLAPIMRRLMFSPFSHDKSLRLYITHYSTQYGTDATGCRVAQLGHEYE